MIQTLNNQLTHLRRNINNKNYNTYKAKKKINNRKLLNNKVNKVVKVERKNTKNET